jgi:hypothetical protein
VLIDVLSSRCEDEERTKTIYHKAYLSLVCHLVKFEPQGIGVLMPEKVSEINNGTPGHPLAFIHRGYSIETRRQGERKTLPVNGIV